MLVSKRIMGSWKKARGICRLVDKDGDKMEEEDKQDDWVDIVGLPENVSVEHFKAMVAV